MKKALLIGFIIVLGAGLYFFRAQFFNGVSLATPAQISNEVVAALSNQDLLPPPLRSNQAATSAVLTRAGVISQTNIERKNNGGLPALKENAKLDQDAKLKLDDMFKNQYFEHISPTGVGPSDLANKVGYQYVLVGENLALGNFESDAALLTAWMNSPGHRANILNPKFREIGVAVGQGIFEGKKTWLAVQSFGTPLSACPAVNVQEKAEIDQLNAQIQAMQPQIAAAKADLDASRNDPRAYNSKIPAYNALVDQYNALIAQLKTVTAQYNASVNAFNNCLAN